MTPLRLSACLFVVSSIAVAQPVLVEPPDYPQTQPGPQAVYSGEGCFLLASGVIFPGDVDWIRVRLPRASSRTVIDVDFPTGTSGSALLALVTNGTTGFNIGDSNNTRDALCGLNAVSSPVGSLRDSVVDLRETSINANISIAVTGAADTSFVGLHMESFAYEVWVYALPYPCANDIGCDDGVACTVDVCDVATGDCSNTPSNDACDDDFFCNGAEWCSPTSGCRAGQSPTCDDDVDCTDDYCDWGMDQCIFEPVHEWCENGLFCDGEEYCNVQTGCQAGQPVDCDDGVACTVDTCDEDYWDCLHTTSDVACDDGQFCNGAERCDLDAGCLAGADPCLTGQSCDETTDECVSASFSMDVRPGVCPAKIMTNAQGQLPIALVGTDVEIVDVTTLRLSRADGVGTPLPPMQGPPGPGPKFNDVSSPTEPCVCPGGAPDGFDDLIVPFDIGMAVESLQFGTISSGTQVELRLSGNLLDGTPFSATDCVTIQSPGGNSPGTSRQTRRPH